MTKLWESLTRELGSAFRTQYGESGGHVFNHWRNELSQFSEAQLFAGFEKFKNSGKSYMSLNVFRNHCRSTPKELGLPDEETAFKAVIFGNWGVLTEQLKAALGGSRYDLRQMTEANARKRFKEIYRDVTDRIAAGEVFTIPERAQIASPSGTVHTRKYDGPTGNEALQNLLGMVGSQKAVK